MKRQLKPIRKPQAPKVVTEKAIEETPVVEEINLGFEIDPTKTYIFETIKKSENPRSENLGSVTKAYDNVEKRYRELRYFPTAASIFTEEQHESFDDIIAPPLVFWRNTLYAQGEDIRLMEYLLNHPLYEHSPFRIANKPAFFTLADKEVQEEIKAKKHATELRALEVIKETPIDDVRPVARTIFGITEDSDTAIINALNELVKKPKQGLERQSNAERLIDNIGNPQILRTYVFQSAVDRGILSTDMNQMQVRMIEGNVFVYTLQTKEPIKELVNWSFSDDGSKFYTTLRRKI